MEEDNAASGINDVAKELVGLERKIAGIIKHITLDNAARAGHLDILLKLFEKINKIQQDLTPEGISPPPQISLARIHELAVTGGGSTADIDDLQAANARFEEENFALSSAVQTLSFEIEQLQKKALDAKIEAGTETVPTVDELKTSISSLTVMLDNIEEACKRLQDIQVPDSAAAQALGWPEFLKEEKLSLGYLGRMLSKATGIRGQRKDIVLETLFKVALAANQQLQTIVADVSETKAGMAAITKHMVALELTAGYPERQTEQYKSALGEIENWQAKYARLEALGGDVASLEANIIEKVGIVDKLTDEVNGLEEASRLAKERLNEELDVIRKKIAEQRPELVEEKNIKISELEILAKNLNDKHVKELKDANEKLSCAEKAAEKWKQEAHDTGAHLDALKLKIHQAADTLYLIRLENEIAVLTDALKTSQQAQLDAQAKNAEIEIAMKQWLTREENSARELNSLRLKDRFKKAVLGGGAALMAGLGFGTAYYLGLTQVTTSDSVPLIDMSVVLTVAAISSAVTGGAQWMATDKSLKDNLKACAKVFALATMFGSMVSCGQYVTLAEQVDRERNFTREQHRNDCGADVCVINRSGGTSAATRLGELYNGRAVVLSYSQVDGRMVEQRTVIEPGDEVVITRRAVNAAPVSQSQPSVP